MICAIFGHKKKVKEANFKGMSIHTQWVCGRCHQSGEQSKTIFGDELFAFWNLEDELTIRNAEVKALKQALKACHAKK